ncbi:MAG: OmpA family protein [Leptospiraceae bacterium]|nr:OmpA family protein [Leptospiraceae bacterium]
MHPDIARAQTTANANADTSPVQLQFKLAPKEILTVDKYQDIRIGQNQALYQSREEKNRIVLKVTAADRDGSRLQGQFLTYSRTPSKTGAFQLNQRFFTDFIIQPNGHYVVSNQYVMPNLRSMPTFPNKAVQKGDTWQAPATELVNIGNQKIVIPVMAEYHYAGIQELKLPNQPARPLHRIEYKYTLNHAINDRDALVQKISGFTMCVLWFDAAAGIPVYDTSRLVYDFAIADGQHQEYLFRIESWYNKVKQIEEEEKKAIIADIARDLDKPQELQVREHKDGIVLELGDILFDHNKATLNNSAAVQLEQVASILKKYPDREIRILGHTDSTGSPAYNQVLSTARAKTVLQSLQNQHSINGQRMSFQGYGEKQPVADNDNAAGRARNRRVEVLIVTD